MAIEPTTTPQAAYSSSSVGRFSDLASIKAVCRVDEDGCWLWRGKSIGGRHPVARVDRVEVLIRRHVFHVQGKYLKSSRLHVVRPTCGTLTCVCPDHLETISRGTMSRESAVKMNSELRTAKTMAGRIAAGQVKLSYEKAEAIRLDPRRHAVVAADYGVNPSMVSRIRRGQAWVTPVAIGSSVFTFRPA